MAGGSPGTYAGWALLRQRHPTELQPSLVGGRDPDGRQETELRPLLSRDSGWSAELGKQGCSPARRQARPGGSLAVVTLVRLAGTLALPLWYWCGPETRLQPVNNAGQAIRETPPTPPAFDHPCWNHAGRRHGALASAPPNPPRGRHEAKACRNQEDRSDHFGRKVRALRETPSIFDAELSH